MRVMIVADVVGGVRTFAAELVRALVARGEDVHLALIGPATGAAWVRELDVGSSELTDLRLEWMPEPWDDVAATSEWVAELAARHDPEVLHMNTFTPVLDPALPVVLSAHSCVLSWWRAVHGCEAPPDWGRYRDLVARAIARATVLAAPSAALLSELRELYALPADARVIANGRRLAPERVGREPLTVSVGRLWDPAKNFALVAAAAPCIDGPVVAIGPGEGHGAQQGAERGVQYTGEIGDAEVIGWLSRAAVFAEPARYEPFGLSALEAALCGCPLVLGDIPSLREVWGEAASYVAVDDPQELAAAVNGLLRDSRRHALAVRAAAARAARYTPEAVARAYIDAYAAALVARRAGTGGRVPA